MALGLPVLLAGCSLLRQEGETVATGGTIQLSEQELRNELISFAERFSARVQAAANDISYATDDPQVRRHTVVWKLRMIPECQRATTHRAPAAAFLDIWALCVQQRHYLERTPPPAMFKEHQPIAVKAARDIEADMLVFARRLLPEGRVDDAAREIEQFAKQSPIGDGFTREAYAAAEPRFRGFAALNWVLQVPMVPIRALQGLDETAVAVQAVADVADRFTSVVAGLPEVTRWELELVLLDLRERGVLGEALQTVPRLKETLDEVIGTTRSLPGTLGEEVRTTVEHAMEQVDARQTELRATLERAHAAIGDLDQAIRNAETLAHSVEEVARGATEAGAAWEEMFHAVGALRTPEHLRDPNRPRRDAVDIADAYAQASRDLERAAKEVQIVLEQCRAFVAGGDVRTILQGVQDQARSTVAMGTEEARGLVDHVYRRAVQLVLIAGATFAAVGLLLHLVRRRSPRA